MARGNPGWLGSFPQSPKPMSASSPLELPLEELPAVDPDALARLARFGGNKLRDQMIELYLTAAPERVAAIRSGLAAADPAAAELAFHSLKASSAQLGAMRMGRLSEQGEIITRGNSLEGVLDLVEVMERELTRVEVWLADVRDGAVQ